MTHHKDDTTIARVMETLIENGMESMGEAFGILHKAELGIHPPKFKITGLVDYLIQLEEEDR